ncbi:hypothetical protein PAHAL_7G300100 [Panicum hallii]|uniref:Uncharacterized protein n=1 Tax=Panicum hallii TaxID=206008 RepID=A0A2T8IDZ8_9POAL|nr:hypothetical protein PAHAL_7G300100 [Panicum hallii]
MPGPVAGFGELLSSFDPFADAERADEDDAPAAPRDGAPPPRAAAQRPQAADHGAGAQRGLQLRQDPPGPQAGPLLQRHRGGGRGAHQRHPAAGRPPQGRRRVPRQGRHGQQAQRQDPRRLAAASCFGRVSNLVVVGCSVW